MKVYVIKRTDGSYYRRHFDNYVQFDNDLMCAEMCSIKESAEDTIDFIARNKYKFNILREELSVVEVQLMETSELADHTKQVRKEVCDRIKWLARAKGIFGQSCKDMNYLQFNEILDQIQGGKDER